jgi:hypothetical protein
VRGASQMHMLAEAEQLHRRLQHICYVIPRGRAYLGTIQAFIGLYRSGGHHYSQPLTPPRNLPDNLNWWARQLAVSRISRPIPRIVPVLKVQAFSDASSSADIAVVIDTQWRAWRLLPGWKCNGRDIGWAEVLRFGFACKYVFSATKCGSHIRV